MKVIYDTDEEYIERITEYKLDPHVIQQDMRIKMKEEGRWMDRDGHVFKIEDMKTSHIQNCLKYVYKNYEWNKPYIERFEQELKKRGEPIRMNYGRAEHLLKPLYQELKEKEDLNAAKVDQLDALRFVIEELNRLKDCA